MNEFDRYREAYYCMTFEERKRLHEKWLRQYPYQKRFNQQWVLGCFKGVVYSLSRNDFKVVELGGFDGSLALEVLKRYPRLRWLNIEVIKHKMVAGLEKYKYREHELSKQLWEEGLDLTKYDVFVASHVLEHIADYEFKKLLAFLNANQIEFLIMDIPIAPNGQTWDGYNGSHVLQLGSNQVKAFLAASHVLVKEEGAWRSLWRLRH